MRLFILKMLAVLMSLVCVLLMEGILMDGLPMLGGLALLALCGFITLWLFQASVKTPARRRRPVYQAPPSLRVAGSADLPHGPKAA